MNKQILALIFLSLLFGSCSHRPAQRSPSSVSFSCAHSFRPKTKIAQQSSVELEVTISPKLMQLITTRDGTIGPLISFSDVPPKLLKKYRLPKNAEKFESYPFEKINYLAKIELIQAATKRRGIDFYANREILGLRIKDEVNLKFKEDTSFLGKTYKAGTHNIKISKYMGKVEYRGPSDVRKKFEGVELHFRTDFSAGINSQSASTLLDGLGVPRVHQHVHSVAKIPITKLKNAPKEMTMAMGDFFRRTNLLAEIYSTYYQSAKVSQVVDGNIIYFSYLTRDKLKGVTQYFSDLSKGIYTDIGDKFKMGWVGMRGHDKYDVEGLWGIEYRSIMKDTDQNDIQTIMDALQLKMLQADYGDLSRYSKWLKKRGDSDIPTLLTKEWYHQDIGQSILRNSDSFSSNHHKVLQELFDEHDHLKMLFHNWSKDPLIFDNPNLIEKMAQAQKEGQKSLRAIIESGKEIGYFDVKKIMSRFYENSGLLESVYKSFDLNITPLN